MHADRETRNGKETNTIESKLNDHTQDKENAMPNESFKKKVEGLARFGQSWYKHQDRVRVVLDLYGTPLVCYLSELVILQMHRGLKIIAM